MRAWNAPWLSSLLNVERDCRHNWKHRWNIRCGLTPRNVGLFGRGRGSLPRRTVWWVIICGHGVLLDCQPLFEILCASSMSDLTWFEMASNLSLTISRGEARCSFECRDDGFIVPSRGQSWSAVAALKWCLIFSGRFSRG